jgi:UPF0716 protein FxsA
MGKLLLLFIAIPAIELALLIQVGKLLGIGPTIALTFASGALGAVLARRQGLSVLRGAQSKMERGEIPVGSMADGILILLAAALLITPGVLTDALGFLLLVPAVRNVVKSAVLRRLRRAVDEKRIRVYAAGFGFPSEAGTTYGPPFDPTGAIDLEQVSDTPKHKFH